MHSFHIYIKANHIFNNTRPHTRPFGFEGLVTLRSMRTLSCDLIYFC